MRLQVLLAALVGTTVAALAVAGCGSRCDLHPCDIRKASCQKATAAGAACLRGVAPVDVPMRVVSRNDYLAQSAGAATMDPDRAGTAAWITAMGPAGPGRAGAVGR